MPALRLAMTVGTIALAVTALAGPGPALRQRDGPRSRA